MLEERGLPGVSYSMAAGKVKGEKSMDIGKLEYAPWLESVLRQTVEQGDVTGLIILAEYGDDDMRGSFWRINEEKAIRMLGGALMSYPHEEESEDDDE